jgi:phosphoglycolate phosphatase
MKSIDLFVFDLDGTLIDTLGDITASVNFTLARLGKQPLDMKTVRRYVGDGINMLMERSLGGRSDQVPEAVTIYRDHHRRNLAAHSTLYPGVRETLEHFKAIPKVVITNKSMEFCSPLLDHLGITQTFNLVIGADNGLPLKPAPDAVLKIMAEYGATKGRTVIVGDGITDIQAGKASGIVTCAVTYGFRSEEELKKAEPDFIIHEFSELKKLFAPVTK